MRERGGKLVLTRKQRIALRAERKAAMAWLLAGLKQGEWSRHMGQRVLAINDQLIEDFRAREGRRRR